MSTIAAIIVTYNRADTLQETLSAIQRQVRQVDIVYVVDNASIDATAEVVAAAGFRYVLLSENLGYAAGLAAGMKLAYDEGADFFWLMDDDTQPHPDALARLIAESRPRRVVALGGAKLRYGVPIGGHQVGLVDCILVDSSLFPRAAVEEAGVPRASFFMMFEDVEYSYRLREHGFELWRIDENLALHKHLGSSDPTSYPWRNYYQTRNHLRVTLERRSGIELYGWTIRQVRFVVRALSQRRWMAVWMRLRGAWDGMRGVEGRTVEPK
jgi:rhamnopyranosyl-N-acetylglucosaminyl-diphospho-decaprenol beta-1,3/1,4-galactofuranosyltransferase